MIPMHQFKNVSEVLAHLAMDESEWSYRYVKLVFNQKSEAWVLLYPLQGNNAPYFDFAYQSEVTPEKVLEGFLAIHRKCEVIDWSRGRLACIQVSGANMDLLAEIITDVAKTVFHLDPFTIETFYEEMGRA
jgi:hypothetical protein